jgi:hypothetical protein
MQRQPSTTAQSGVAFAEQPIIQLQDAGGADLGQSGVEVTASIATGTGTLGGDLTQTTNANGEATFTDLSITGPTGSYTLRFTAPDVNQALSEPISIAAAAGSIVITTNPPVSALDKEVFAAAAQPAVQVKDGSGNPVNGTEVTARIRSGSGSLEGATTATTNASGVATFGDLGIAGTGDHTLEFAAGSATVTSSPVDVVALSPQATSGEWGPVVDWANVVPLHISLLPSGKVIAWGRNENDNTMGMPRVWDPANGSPTNLPAIHVDTMLFCAGHTLMPDGRLMVSGGHKADDRGIKVTNFFSADGAWAGPGTPSMAYGRWYPTTTVLGDGRVLTMGGRDENGATVTIPELWNGTGWIELPGAGTVHIPYYPRNFVAPDGRIFYAGEQVMSRWFSVSGSGSWSNGPSHIWQFNRDYGTAAMYEPGKILVAGGGGNTAWVSQAPGQPMSPTPTATAEKIDLLATSPTWQSAGSMSAPRRHLNATILPDGQVLITGGSRGGKFVDASAANAVRAAEVWNPVTGQWTTLASASKVRVYHSVSLLMPDGKVLHGASGYALDSNTGQEIPAERNHEMFSPPYLFKGTRPTITSAPSSVGYGETITIATPNAAQITEVRWIRLGSVTHAIDMSQRANKLAFTKTATGVEVTAPANGNLAPPGP